MITTVLYLAFLHPHLLLGLLNPHFKWLQDSAGADGPPGVSAIAILLNTELSPMFTAKVAMSIFLQTAFPPSFELFP